MLNNIGLPGLLLIAVVVLVLFGRGKISSLMGEVGKGITSFKRGVAEGSKEEEEKDAETRAVENQTAAPRDVTPATSDETVVVPPKSGTTDKA
ncbi:Sec-independent protein translocase TatA [Brevirhabdus pacifica]|uniref:Sec-independent protein translocase protein TatA n=1 Tax=Brevirhabdus pacifica TaxID=1267768 RepID=A0A1U7DKW6_9RHOB|nr:twin-arginine translocase TatA/TatE family subunit [Brevirhabdus pacifica]APX90644.1 Sec-independent protein translocase TatA [Brevirhabdus pacifica]PJJ85212.1 sec-independent protein translocase protein TatA [Brevirhabdus pacifica]